MATNNNTPRVMRGTPEWDYLANNTPGWDTLTETGRDAVAAGKKPTQGVYREAMYELSGGLTGMKNALMQNADQTDRELVRLLDQVTVAFDGLWAHMEANYAWD